MAIDTDKQQREKVGLSDNCYYLNHAGCYYPNRCSCDCHVPAPVPAEGVEGQSVLNATMRKYDAWIERDGSSIFIFAPSANFTKRKPYYKDGVTQPYNLLSIRIQNDNYELPGETVEQIAAEIELRLDTYSANQAEREVVERLAEALKMHMQWIGPAPTDAHSYDSLREDAWKLGIKALAAFNQLRGGGE